MRGASTRVAVNFEHFYVYVSQSSGVACRMNGNIYTQDQSVFKAAVCSASPR